MLKYLNLHENNAAYEHKYKLTDSAIKINNESIHQNIHLFEDFHCHYYARYELFYGHYYRDHQGHHHHLQEKKGKKKFKK